MASKKKATPKLRKAKTIQPKKPLLLPVDGYR
jgi:hypothetical protein